MRQEKKQKQNVIIILLAFASSFLLSNLVRNINAIVAPSLISTFDLSNDELGLVTSVFLASLAVAQLPLGVAIDKYGPRISHISLLIVAIIGCLLFAAAPNYITLIIARMLIGIGVSGGLICGLVVISRRASAKNLTNLYGLYMAFGGIGILCSGYPTLIVYNLLGWRFLFVIIAIITALTLYMVIGIRDESITSDKKTQSNNKIQFSEYKTIFKSPYFQAVAPVVGISSAIFTSCIGIWSAVFMREVQELTEIQIALIISISAILLTICPPIFGLIISYSEKHFPRISLEQMLLILISPAPIFFLLAVIPNNIMPYSSQWNWLGMAFCFSAIIQVYAYVTKKFPIHLTGRVNTMVNVFFFLGAFIVQYGTGLILQLLIDNTTLNIKVIYIYVMAGSGVIMALSIMWMPYRLYLARKNNETQYYAS